MSQLNMTLHDLNTKPMNIDTNQSLVCWVENTWANHPGIMLAHAYDGVIWGWFDRKQLHTAPHHPGFPWPPLRWETLLALRMFSETTELRMWRSETGFKSVQISQTQGDQFHAFMDRSYILLGQSSRQEFSPRFDRLAGSRGECQAVPKGATRIQVRHSFTIDPTSGILRETEHRWLTILDTQGQPIRELK